MTRKLSVGVLAAALLVSGALVGVSFGGGGGITQPEVIELSVILWDPDSFRMYGLRDPDYGKGKAVIAVSHDSVFDVDRDDVGSLRQDCVDWVCTYVFGLKAGPHTERGTVVATGVYRFGKPTRFAVTGGTGAYENISGYIDEVAGEGQDEDRTFLTLNLTP